MGRYLEIIRQVEEAHKPTEGIVSPEGGRDSRPELLAPGRSITWQGPDGKERGPAVVDFLHTDAEGTKWAFVTLPEGWAAVNLKYARKIDDAM